jgi:2-dehydro-3-deoxyphosphogluconate aldolase / (4S)-4-hydroxy-2-oxoglutarate aldolase
VDKEKMLQFMIDGGVVAIVRADNSAQLVQVAECIKEGGVQAIEFTMTTPDALDLIKETSKKLGSSVLLGAGTVLDPETCRAAILAGAQFIVTPTLNTEVIKMCQRYSKVVIPGAFTPTEILTAWEAGADIVKVFPATLGGPGYIKDVRAPLPQIRLAPTGGVNLENTGDFIKAGAVAVAVGSNLVNNKLVKEGRLAEMTETARKFVAEVKKARGQA